jgi:hypothetical protein
MSPSSSFLSFFCRNYSSSKLYESSRSHVFLCFFVSVTGESITESRLTFFPVYQASVTMTVHVLTGDAFEYKTQIEDNTKGLVCKPLFVMHISKYTV